MAFLRDPHGKQVFTTSGTWTHPTPGANLQVTLTLVGGGGGGQGSTNGGNGGNTTATPTGGDTTTAKGGAGGGVSAVAGAGAKQFFPAPIGPAGVGIYGLGGAWANNSKLTGQCGGVTVTTITTAANIALVVGAAGTAGTGAATGGGGLAIVEW